jgi:TolB protein
MLPVRNWNWGVPTSTLRIRATSEGATVPACIEALDHQGHALVPPDTPLRFDSQNGRTYFHIQGEISWTVPAGQVRVTATRGFTASPVARAVDAKAGRSEELELPLAVLTSPRSRGWYSGDLHFHLNYGGPYRLKPEDLLPIMAGEDLDLATPMAANLVTRLVDSDLLGWRKQDAPPLIAFAQEVRSNFFGHLGLLHLQQPYRPWAWGPDIPVTREQNLLNADALHFARETGAFSCYVHPVTVRELFAPENLKHIPLAYVADAVLGHVDALEISGLWLHELGAAELWYRVLNIGVPLLPAAGTDAFPNFFRCSVVGSNRTFVHVDGPCTFEAYYAGLRRGNCYVSSGPLVDFRMAGALPGEIIKGRKVPWTLELSSASPLSHLGILVNGRVARTLQPLAGAGSIRLQGDGRCIRVQPRRPVRSGQDRGHPVVG